MTPCHGTSSRCSASPSLLVHTKCFAKMDDLSALSLRSLRFSGSWECSAEKTSPSHTFWRRSSSAHIAQLSQSRSLMRANGAIKWIHKVMLCPCAAAIEVFQPGKTSKTKACTAAATDHFVAGLRLLLHTFSTAWTLFQTQSHQKPTGKLQVSMWRILIDLIAELTFPEPHPLLGSLQGVFPKEGRK